jgi:hypothetical protein
VVEASLAPSFAIFFALYSNSAAAVVLYNTAALSRCSVAFLDLVAFFLFFFTHVFADMVRFVIVSFPTAAALFYYMSVKRLISNVNYSALTVMTAMVAMT